MTRSQWLVATSIALASLFAYSAESAAEEETADLGPSRDYLISGQIMRGWILRHNDSGFTFKVDAEPPLDVVVENIPWEALPEVEGARVRQKERTDVGLSPAEESRNVDKIEATRYTLKTGRVITGIYLPELSSTEAVFIRTKYASQFRIARRDVLSEEPIMVQETQMYSLEELRERKINEINPTQGREYMELGMYLMRIGHFAGAKDAFERAMLLEPRFEEAATKHMQEVEIALNDEVAKKLADQILADKRAERYKEALEKIRQLRGVAPDSHHLLQLETMIPEIEKAMGRDTRRRVVAAYYAKMDELIRNHVYGRVVDGESIPGVVVSTKNGSAYKGALKSEDDEFIEVDIDGRLIKIARELVVGVDHVDLNPKRRDPTFAESKEYVKDTTGGLAAEVLKNLEEQFSDDGITQEDLKAYWDDRLTDVVVVTRSGTERTPPVYMLRDVSYATGTWLREGEQIAVTDGGGGGRRNSKRGGIETDPERWWKSQPPELRSQVLRAIAAEHQCVVDKVYRQTCNHCGGKGYFIEISTGGDVSDAPKQRICPSCRGAGKFTCVRYK